MTNRISPIAQFRSKVQWYLEGNTPSFTSELAADLLVALKVLGKSLPAIEKNEIEIFREFSGSLSIDRLQEMSVLMDVASHLRALLELRELKVTDMREFRDSVVQLILVAESRSELSFRKAVLDLAKSIN